MFSNYFGIYAEGLMKVILEKLKEFILKARASLPISDLKNLLPSIKLAASSSTTAADSDIQNFRSKFRERNLSELLKSQNKFILALQEG